MFQSESESEEVPELTINKSYATNYNTWRQKEEIQKLKDKYGDTELEGSETSSESEDENAEALTQEVEKGWFKTLSALKSKDPKIYDQSTQFYETKLADNSNDVEFKSNKEKKEKPIYLKDYERKLILEKEGKYIDEESCDEEEGRDSVPKTPGYYQLQEEIKKGFQSALAESDSETEDFLQKRDKTKEEEIQEETDYVEWLKGQKDTIEEEAGVDLSHLRNYWHDPNLDEGEKYLRDFFLNKRYLEDDTRIPTYDEIVNDDEDISEEERQLEKEEVFEKKYNFRFEEPDPEFIKSYPRTIGESVRRNDDRRSKKRLETKNRKDVAKEQKKEELKRLKNLKKKEIQDKIDKLKQITGNDEIGFSNIDINEDFDPEEYDKRMKVIFNDDYYAAEEDDVKPVFPDDEELDIPDVQWDDEYGYKEEEEIPWNDTDFNMDADYDPNSAPTGRKKLSKKERRLLKKQKKNKNEAPASQTIESTAEDEVIDESAVDAAFEEYYKLDYEDMIDDIPCRFKYRPVVANNFGLETEEILKCPERELNMWVSVKKMSQYRTDEEETWDVRKYKKSARLKKKHNVLTSLVSKENEKSKDVLEEHIMESASMESVAMESATMESASMESPSMDSTSMESLSMGPASINCVTESDALSSDIILKNSINTDNSIDSCNSAAASCSTQSKNDCNRLIDTVSKQSSNASSSKNKKNSSKKKKRKLLVHATSSKTDQSVKKKKKINPISTISDERLKAYGFDPKKIKYTTTWQKQLKINK